MSGQKKLDRVTKNIRVVATPTRKVERQITDINGQPIRDKNGEPMVDTVQLYKIKKMR